MKNADYHRKQLTSVLDDDTVKMKPILDSPQQRLCAPRAWTGVGFFLYLMDVFRGGYSCINHLHSVEISCLMETKNQNRPEVIDTGTVDHGSCRSHLRMQNPRRKGIRCGHGKISRSYRNELPGDWDHSCSLGRL